MIMKMHKEISTGADLLEVLQLMSSEELALPLAYPIDGNINDMDIGSIEIVKGRKHYWGPDGWYIRLS